MPKDNYLDPEFMNDKFKVRFWDKTYNRMCYPDYTTWNDSMEVHYSLIDREETSIISAMHAFKDTKKFIPLLCSGLRDKNNTLIYEGDVLKFRHGKGFRNGVVIYTKTIWNVSNCNFVQGAYCGGALINLHKDSEIVGNQYENFFGKIS